MSEKLNIEKSITRIKLKPVTVFIIELKAQGIETRSSSNLVSPSQVELLKFFLLQIFFYDLWVSIFQPKTTVSKRISPIVEKNSVKKLWWGKMERFFYIFFDLRHQNQAFEYILHTWFVCYKQSIFTRIIHIPNWA